MKATASSNPDAPRRTARTTGRAPWPGAHWFAVLTAALISFDAGLLEAQIPGAVLLNDGWEYLEEPLTSPSEASAYIGWAPVRLPHSWNAFDAVDPEPGYRRSAGWYRKVVTIPATSRGQRVLLCFEAVNMKSEIYVNGLHAGGHVGGYLGFDVDITGSVRFGQADTILVRADNSVDIDLIPSHKSDFILYGGIVRDVWLLTAPPIRISLMHVATPAVSTTKAGTSVQLEIDNATSEAANLELEVTIVDPLGSPVGMHRQPLLAPAGLSNVRANLPPVQTPKLWSPVAPNLYRLKAELRLDGSVVDSHTEVYGYRWWEFKENGPFFLNGKRLLLRGTQRHEDHAALGGAVPDSITRLDFRLIKDMGANFVRLGHYPQDPEVYRVCDSLGLLVWDELPWCRGGMGGSLWKANARQMLNEMISQHFNHPSIILWSIGNEVDADPDRPGGAQVDSLRAFLSELDSIAHALDPGRLTAMRRFPEGADIPDVFSPSIWMGWYRGAYGEYEKAISEAHDRYSRLFHAEYGGDSHVGRHTENPIDRDGWIRSSTWDTAFVPVRVRNVSRDGDWSESYIVDLFDWHLRVSESLPWFAGSAQWIFKDFATPLRPENPIPFVNQKGLLDRSGKPKDAYYVYKSYWNTTTPFCYIQSHTWTVRSGLEGIPREVRVYSNCDTVELLLNGKSLGQRARKAGAFPAHGMTWQAAFTEGPNLLIARGSWGGTMVTGDTVQLEYSFTRHGPMTDIALSAVKLPTGNYTVTALAVDAQGRQCLSQSDRVYFSLEGAGRLRSNEGTPTGSAVIEFANGRAAIEFIPVRGASSVIEARTHDNTGSYVFLND